MKTKKIGKNFKTALTHRFSLGVRPEKENSNAVLSLRHLSLLLKAKGSRLLTSTLNLFHNGCANRPRGTNAFYIPQSRISGQGSRHWFLSVYWPAEGMAILPLDVWLYRSRQFSHAKAASRNQRISCDGAGRKALVQGLIDPVLRRRPPWDTGRFADTREVNIAETARAEIQRKPIRRRCVR